MFICENNIYSTHTHIKDRQFNKNITKKVESMGVESVKLRTNNPIQVFNTMNKVIKKVRALYGQDWIDNLKKEFKIKEVTKVLPISVSFAVI